MRHDPRLPFDPEYRPNTRKMFEEYHGVTVPKGVDVHHVLPLRHGGKHEVSNLVPLRRDEHAAAHLQLYRDFGDARDLCAHYMILGRTEEAALAASAMGGRASQIAKKARGEANGFQMFTTERRREVAAGGGRVGGTKQRDLGIGIHVDPLTRAGWARLGALAVMVSNGFLDPAVQSERGKRGGSKNKGFKWCTDGIKQVKYTVAQQNVEPFVDFLARTGMRKGKLASPDRGGKFYNNGIKQFVFRAADHVETFDDFLKRNGYMEGRIK